VHKPGFYSKETWMWWWTEKNKRMKRQLNRKVGKKDKRGL